MKHLKTLTEWTSWHDDLYEPGETWVDRVSQMREEQRKQEELAKKKKKQTKAIPPKYKSRVATTRKWKQEQKKRELEYADELRESKSLSGIEIEYKGRKRTVDIPLIKKFLTDFDLDTLLQYSTEVDWFEIEVSHKLNISIDEIFKSKSSISINRLKSAGDFFVEVIWLNMGNGLTSISIEQEYGTYSKYQIFSGEKQLTKFISEELPTILEAEKYNL